MRAAVIDEYGKPENIKIKKDYPMPILSNGEVIVKVKRASINPIDYKISSGKLASFLPVQLPKILGFDLAGIIHQVSDNETQFKVGDEVYGQADFFNGGGSIAEFTVAKVSSLSLKPAGISFDEAASLPLVAVSALQGVEDNMHLSRGQKILIQGGAGGIGSIAIQIAKHLGAYVATTVSTKDIDYVIQLGADLVVDYSKDNFTTLIKDYDTVLDLIGGKVYEDSFKVLKKRGVIVTLAAQPNDELSEKYEVNSRYQSTNVDSRSLDKISDLIKKDIIKPNIEKIFNIDDTAQAFAYAEDKRPSGKIVISIDS